MILQPSWIPEVDKNKLIEHREEYYFLNYLVDKMSIDELMDRYIQTHKKLILTIAHRIWIKAVFKDVLEVDKFTDALDMIENERSDEDNKRLNEFNDTIRRYDNILTEFSNLLKKREDKFKDIPCHYNHFSDCDCRWVNERKLYEFILWVIDQKLCCGLH